MSQKHSRRFQEVLKKVNRAKNYEMREAIELLKGLSSTKFDESLEIAMRLGVDPRKAEENIRGTCVLPHGTGRVFKVAVIAKGEAAIDAEQAGAERVGAEELVAEIENGWADFDVLVAHVDMMRIVGKLGKTLGPRTPNRKSGTATEDVAEAIRQIKAGKVEYRVDRQSNMSVPLGRLSFDTEKLLENYKTLMVEVLAARPAGLKGVYIRQVVMSSSMGPGLRVDPQHARDVAQNKVVA
jgi:large subunit ribosomal protein L1